MEDLNRLRLKLIDNYELSMIQPKGATSIEVALINPEGDIEEFSSAFMEEPDQVHQNLSAHQLIRAIYRAETHIRRGNYYDK